MPRRYDPRRAPIPPDFAAKIWRVLVEECGCRDDEREARSFEFYVGSDERGFGHEWRFGGKLGFGGKFYNDHSSWRVGCYGEDRTPERELMIGRANARLDGLREVFLQMEG